MEYQKFETKSGIIVVKDAEEYELVVLIDVYKKAFNKHNIFQKPYEEVLEYLKTVHRKNRELGGGFIVARLEEKTIGGLLVKKNDQDIDGKHSTWKYNHMVVAHDYKKMNIGTALMNAADQKIKQLIQGKIIKTAKVEVSVSENEKDSLAFFKKFGFEEEGKLKSHYRFGELVYILGKEIT